MIPARFLEEHFQVLAQSPGGVKRLRELILQLAVRGKLVSRDASDEPASVLLEKIKREKERLIEEGKIKKQKPLPPIGRDEIPYEIPENWEWVRLDNICEYIQRGKSPKYVENSDIPVISQKCIQWNGFHIKRARFIDPSTVSKYSQERFLRRGDLLWNSTGTGTLGRINIYSQENHNYEKVVADTHVTIIRPLLLIQKYILFFLSSPTVQDNIDIISSGSTKQKELSSATVKAHIIPLPPYNEQKRIVERVDQLMELCDRLEERQEKCQKKIIRLNNASLDQLLQSNDNETFNTNWRFLARRFHDLYDHPENVAQLKQAILQLAVMGKLVPQDPEEEPASVLLEKIKKEKERLIEEGKIKKPKPLPPIKEDEKLFTAPNSWSWARLAQLGEFTGGGTPSKRHHDYWDGTIPWVSPKDVKTKYISSSGLQITEKAIINCKLRLIPPNSILIVARSGILKRTLPVSINKIPCTVNQDLKVIIPFFDSTSDFLQLLLKGFENFILNELVKGGVTVQSLKYSEFEAQAFPIPPLGEQRRIVEKVDQLMNLCDSLQDILQNAQNKSQSLFNALLG